jgi:hypothetical protein
MWVKQSLKNAQENKEDDPAYVGSFFFSPYSFDFQLAPA